MTNNGKWTAADIGDLARKVVVVTGANSGLGWEATKVFADKGAHVVMAQSAEMGALPTLYAALDDDVKGGDYIGPANGMRGYPAKAELNDKSHNREDAAKLWTVSEQLTDVKYAGFLG